MTSNIIKLADQQPAATATAQLFDNWFDPIEACVRDRVHGFIQAMIEAELDEALSRTRYARRAKACPGPRSETPGGETAGDGALRGHRHGHRSRSLMGTFGETRISVPRARIEAPDGKTTEWRSKVLPAYQRRTKAADALIAGAYPAGTNTRRGPACACRPVRRHGQQGYGQPGLAEGEGRLGKLEPALAG
jgi:putative transposase